MTEIIKYSNASPTCCARIKRKTETEKAEVIQTLSELVENTKTKTGNEVETEREAEEDGEKPTEAERRRARAKRTQRE